MLRSLFFSLTVLAFFGTGGSVLAQAYGLTSRPAVGPFLDSVVPTLPPGEPTTWSTADAFPNLSFQNPMGLLPMPGTSKLFVWEREGRVYLIDNLASTGIKTLSIDLTNQCQGWDDCGLFSVVPHPNFQTNHYVFVFYTYVSPGMVVGNPTTRPPGQPTLPVGSDPRGRLSRFTLDANGVAIPGSEFVLINQTITNTWHKGGGMFFHPANGLLYLCVGNDVLTSNDQRIDRDFAAGVLRIDVARWVAPSATRRRGSRRMVRPSPTGCPITSSRTATHSSGRPGCLRNSSRWACAVRTA